MPATVDNTPSDNRSSGARLAVNGDANHRKKSDGEVSNSKLAELLRVQDAGRTRDKTGEEPRVQLPEADPGDCMLGITASYFCSYMYNVSIYID